MGSTVDDTLGSGKTLPRSAPPVDAPLPGLERFEVRERLGSGGMGAVYLANDRVLGRAVALKVLHGGGDDERLLQEARGMAQLAHPNVVSIFDAGRHQGRAYIAMELVDGQSLREWLETPRGWREVCEVFAQAGRGLAAAHTRGLVHRDFKPENVLIDREGRARVADFGLVRLGGAPAEASPASPTGAAGPLEAQEAATALTREGTMLGTPAYMAPEQFDGSAVTAQADVFSFGVALYEALYGQRPFDGDSIAALREAVRTGVVRPPADGRGVPGALHRLVLHSLRPAPGDRPESMTALAASLDRLRAPRRRPLWLGGAVLAVLVALGIGQRLLPQQPAATPGFSASDLIKGYIRRTPAFGACFEQLPASAQVAGELKMRFAIRPTGEVEAIELSGLGADDPAFTACVRRALLQLRFPATASGRPMAVNYPLRYAP